MSKTAKVLGAVVLLGALGAAGYFGYEYIFERTQALTMEAGGELPDPGSFFTRYREKAAYTEEPGEETQVTPGSYTVQIASKGKVYDCTLVIEDTTPPAATPVPQTLVLGQEASAEDFVTDLVDVEPVTVEFAESVDFAKEGQWLVGILLTDAAGNQTTVDAGLTIVRDTTPPVIEGVADQSLYEGETISYKKGVTCSDDITPAEDLQLEIDNSQVDLDTAGEYTVTYRVADAAGNETVATATITVINRQAEEEEKARQEMQEKLDPLVEKAVKACQKSGQTDREFLKKMFDWVRNHMSYTGHSDKSDELGEAYRGFTKGVGDCFTYFAVLKQMMEYAGFETCDVRRINGKTDHFWSLVKVDGEWYHIDSCPRSSAKHPEWKCFLRTDAELEMFTTTMVKGYYTFDTSLVPRTP